jgi:hypothetical protein
MGPENQPSIVPPVHHLQHCTTHSLPLPPWSHCFIAQCADSQPCTTAANPLPGVPTRSSGELQMRPPGCVCRREIRSDSLTPGSPCSTSACQTTLTRGFVLPIVCSSKGLEAASSPVLAILFGTLLASHHGSSGELPYSTVQYSQYMAIDCPSILGSLPRVVVKPQLPHQTQTTNQTTPQKSPLDLFFPLSIVYMRHALH